MLSSVIAAVLAIGAFMIGLRVMRYGSESLAAGKLPNLLATAARTPLRGIVSGAVVTAVLQSSAAVTAITVGFVAGGSLAFENAVSIVLGANVGTTITPQLLSFDLHWISIPCLICGVVVIISGRRLLPVGMVLIGFSGILIGLETLSIALPPLAATPLFAQWLRGAGESTALALIAGCVASAVLQSSTATTVIVMSLAGDGLLSFPGALAMALGANVGSCATSIVAAIGQPRPAQQVAFAHLLLNVLGVLLAWPLLQPFAVFIQHIGGDTERQVANAQTVFNLACTVIAWPLTHQFASLVRTVLPDQLRA